MKEEQKEKEEEFLKFFFLFLRALRVFVVQIFRLQ